MQFQTPRKQYETVQGHGLQNIKSSLISETIQICHLACLSGLKTSYQS